MLEAFTRELGRAPDVTAHAPGRVNLLGEHTDYNLGYVLPTAIALETTIALAAREDDRVVVVSETLAERASYTLGAETRSGGWIDYAAGVTWALRERGMVVRGFDAFVRSTIPLGSGLSSSAALEIALLRALRSRWALGLDDAQLAEVAHRAETEFVGAPVGMLDQLACSLAAPGDALFIDMRSGAREVIGLPTELGLAVVDSGVAHDHVLGGYAERRRECERAAELLGLATLREATHADLARLPEPLRARARHVLSENHRVLAGVAALRRSDLAELGALFSASHASLRDDFCVSVPEVDAIVERALALPWVFGARMTGGGFGGAVIACVRREDAARTAMAIAPSPSRILLPGAHA